MFSSSNLTSQSIAPSSDTPHPFHSVFDPGNSRAIVFKEKNHNIENSKFLMSQNEKKDEKIYFKTTDNEKKNLDSIDVNEAYIEMLVTQKRASFNYIKNWEFKRKQRAGIHLGVAEAILSFAMGVGANSIEGFNVILKLLKEKKKQFERFGKEVKLPNLNKNGGKI
jgi:hypothetical protein